MTDFPSIQSSFRFHTHAPSFIYPSPEATPEVDHDSTKPSLNPTDAPFAWITALLSQPLTLAQPTETAGLTHPSQTLDTASELKTPPSGSSAESVNVIANGGLSKEAKIGIATGIAVVVILSLIAVGFCCLDGRRRIQRWKEKKKAKRETDLNMWETELRTGQSGRRDTKTGGLWDALRLDTNETKIDRPEPREPNKDPVLEKYEYRLANVGMWERIGGTRSESGRSTQSDEMKKEPMSEKHITVREREVEYLPAYIPRDRASIVSSNGSLGLPVVGPPIVAKSFLDK
jgi:hypothetical protein